MQAIGKNIEATVSNDGKTLTLTIDITKSQGRSASGKTEIIATSAGNQPIDGTKGAILGLNLYKK